jgi:hypothetical protein
MNRFERVIQILDNAIGGPDASIGAHGAFWRRSWTSPARCRHGRLRI